MRKGKARRWKDERQTAVLECEGPDSGRVAYLLHVPSLSVFRGENGETAVGSTLTPTLNVERARAGMFEHVSKQCALCALWGTYPLAKEP
jgi:hypothetical protein